MSRNAASAPLTLGEKIQLKMDRFKDVVASTCCSCAERLPSAAVVAITCLIVLILLALIPALFLLADLTANADKFRSGDVTLEQALRGVKQWPKVDPIGNPIDNDDDVGEDGYNIHGISMESMFPINVTLCRGFGFSCTNSVHKIISTSKLCDGIPDCPDGSDEENCKSCQTFFSCPSKPSQRRPTNEDDKRQLKHLENLVCLTANKLCDGVDHCIDGSDENKGGFCKESCDKDEHQCKSQKLCIPQSAVCNGVRDCADESDEENCTKCAEGSMKCGTVCLNPRQICDGFPQCPDQSDEKNCDCKSCSGSDKALCDDGTCVPRSAICDGKKDCSDGMDERDCPGTCMLTSMKPKKSATVTCADRQQYLESEACSGEFEACQRSCPKCNEKTAFKCPAETLCLAKIQVCDGVSDCANGEDEFDCKCDNKKDPFKCFGSNKCIESTQRCDGIRDCYDWSDEQNCENCPADSIRCSTNNSCLPSSHRCNGVLDCDDGSDENDCTCDECTGKHSETYMCDSSTRCLRRDDVCSPYSLCPNATRLDKAYCAGLALKRENNFPW